MVFGPALPPILFLQCALVRCSFPLLLMAGGHSADSSSSSYMESQVKCFCDKFTCPGQLVCSGKWCLIGVRNEGGNGRLDQICGWDDSERPVDCETSWSKWSEVCACQSDLCNTFAFLRASMDSRTLVNRADNGGIYLPAYNDDEDNENIGRDRRKGGWIQNSNLVVLLVIVPLAVGALAVCLVFVNYHCKML